MILKFVVSDGRLMQILREKDIILIKIFPKKQKRRKKQIEYTLFY